MDLTVSRPVKILALVLVIAGVGGVASMQMLGKSSGSGSAPLSVAQIRARAHHTTTTAAPATHVAKPKTHVATPKPVAKSRPKPKAPAVKKPAVTVAKNGLPITLAAALKSHTIVVVSVFDPQSQTDAISYAEARAGAGDAKVGFVGVSVLDDAVAAPLTAALPGGGLLPLPGVLVYRAPSTLVERIDGFADRDSIAALALNARTAPPLTSAPTTSTATTTTPAAPAPAPTSTDSTTTTP